MKHLLIFYFTFNVVWAVDFNKDIQPILSNNCYSCHGKDKQKGKLRLDIKTEAQKVFRKNSLGKIEFLERIHHDDPKEIMPPPKKGKLTQKEKTLLEKWIADNAPYGEHWAFSPPQKTIPPDFSDKWISNDIDKFILSKLNSSELQPNAIKYDHRLFRRISLMLTGLPPSLKDLENFKRGNLPYPKYVNQLLSSKSFGEHFASMWLDSARYGDTNGMQYDSSRPIWPYRDWVINAFNANMPYNQFLTEQIAGDLLPNPSIQQQIATGYLRCNVTTNEMGAIEEEFKARNAKDRLNTTMTTFAGLTVNCAECHDHKYDPISQKEYYQMIAYFNNIDGLAKGFPYERSDAPTINLVDNEKFEQKKNLSATISKLEKNMEDIKSKAKDSFWWWHYKTMSSPPQVIYLMSKLDSFYPLDEKEGTIANNLIKENGDSIKGIPFRKKGKYGNGLGFNARSYLICKQVGKFKYNKPFTVGMWINPQKDNDGTIIGRFNSVTQKGWKVTIDNGYVSVYLQSKTDNALQIISKKSLPINKWSHIAVSYDGSSSSKGIKIYIDSLLTDTKIIKNNLTSEIQISSSMLIGYETHREWLAYCTLDEIFTSTNELNEKQIQAISKFKAASRFALVPPNELAPKYKSELFDYFLKYHHKEYSLLYEKTVKIKNTIKDITNNSPTSMIMKEKIYPEKTFILDRGNYEKKLSQVKRALPEFINISNQSFPKNRLGLAQWLTHKKHPLTARVIVNRIWLQLLGSALVRTPNDFGLQGLYPTHPKLLDYLANYLTHNNWDIKKLITLIVTSSTFKQASIINSIKKNKDSKNKLYSFYKRRRLTAESIRDQALSVSGLLVNKLGGPPVYPYQPSGLWNEVTFDISNTHRYRQSVGENNYRRSIYTFYKRNLPPPFMSIFDVPFRQNCTLQRIESNTPLQALVLLNDPQFVETYKHLSNNLKKKLNVETIFKRLFFRDPTPEELKLSLEFVNENNFYLFIHSLMNTDEFISVE